ncbi:MAG: PEP/pyruvate-binding domain-containing protein [Bacteroidota bacterium]
MKINRHIISLLVCSWITMVAFAKEVPILNYSINDDGQVLLEVASTVEHYYILKVRHEANGAYDLAVAMTMGAAGSTIISESLSAYPRSHYQVLEYEINAPADTDGDGIDDVTEWRAMPSQSPLNAAPILDVEDGVLALDQFSTFKSLSLTKDLVQWSEFLNGRGYVKYLITDFYTDPKVYFIDTETHRDHGDFARHIRTEYLGDNIKKGQVIYHPTSIANNGKIGTFAFNYSNGYGDDFKVVQRTMELLAANMPFLTNNLSYFITERNEVQYNEEIAIYDNSRVSVLLEADVYADIDYWGLHPSEGYGFFRQLSLEEVPGPKDIVLYESIPNSLPRVGGIITSVIQTPLSHVNLRAIQNNVPNAYIRDPLLVDSVAALLDNYIYFKVEQDDYTIRAATLEEVNQWFDDIRPKEEQQPPLNLYHDKILPLSEIQFEDFDGFGAKCTNVAEMGRFGFPEGTIPDGFGVPFYFYQSFMHYNNFFDDIKEMLADKAFQSDRLVREEQLKDLRKKIKKAELPKWMYEALGDMQDAFPAGTSIRCRSSTNNEDLPGFNGAGLYDSKTQHPHEGHIEKSIKQVYASLWNLRAFEERDFYRVDHFQASMGVLCHPNYKDEKANGVGVSIDPIYNTDNTFYLNSQVGEDLITNPEVNSIPEELLLDRTVVSSTDYVVIQRSDQLSNDSLILEGYLDQMRDFLTVIHDRFAKLYRAEGDPNFGMDIEYKVTVDDQLIIKQARPWVGYVLDDSEVWTNDENIQLSIFPNPTVSIATVECENCRFSNVELVNALGQPIPVPARLTQPNRATIDVSRLPQGIYWIIVTKDNGKDVFAQQLIRR